MLRGGAKISLAQVIIEAGVKVSAIVILHFPLLVHDRDLLLNH